MDIGWELWRGSAACVAVGAVAALAAAASAGPYRAPRTADGQPDLQGTWSNMSTTRLERPPGVPLTLATRAEEDAYEAQRRKARAEAKGDDLGQVASEWHQDFPMARIDGKLRTSWIVSPADGRVPYRPEALKRFQALGLAAGSSHADGPEDRTPADRCLVGGAGAAGPPLLNPFTTSGGVQIVQTRGEIAILAEMNHDVRVVRLNGRHPAPSLRFWMGDSIGRWEGDALVVETTNFHPQEGLRGPYMISSDAKVTERFRRVSPREIRYEFEVDDPATFTQPWKGEMPFRADPGRIFEYACHEGNYGLANILMAARHEDQRR